MSESKKYIDRRHRVMDEIANRSNIDQRVIEAMKRVPRQMFVDSHLKEMAYYDRPLPIAAGQTISQIYTVAMQTNLLELEKGATVLEVGTGCGYQTAVLCEMGFIVYSIERQEELYHIAQQNLDTLGYNALLVHGDGFAGLQNYHQFIGFLLSLVKQRYPEKIYNNLF